jgi:hypothetical protein
VVYDLRSKKSHNLQLGFKFSSVNTAVVCKNEIIVAGGVDLKGNQIVPDIKILRLAEEQHNN